MHSGLKNHRYGRDTRGSHVGRKRDRFGGEKTFEGGGSAIRWFGTPRERNKWLKEEVPGKKIISRKNLTRGDWQVS